MDEACNPQERALSLCLSLSLSLSLLQAPRTEHRQGAPHPLNELIRVDAPRVLGFQEAFQDPHRFRCRMNSYCITFTGHDSVRSRS